MGELTFQNHLINTLCEISVCADLRSAARPPDRPRLRLGPSGHARLLLSKCHDGKGANGSKNRPHDAYPVRCRVPDYYEPCSERVRVYKFEKFRGGDLVSDEGEVVENHPDEEVEHHCLAHQHQELPEGGGVCFHSFCSFCFVLLGFRV